MARHRKNIYGLSPAAFEQYKAQYHAAPPEQKKVMQDREMAQIKGIQDRFIGMGAKPNKYGGLSSSLSSPGWGKRKKKID